MSSEITEPPLETVDVPQANALRLVVDLVALASHGMTGKRTLSGELRIAPREVDYYMHAARILGFTEESGDELEVTRKGRELLRAIRPEDRQRVMTEAVKETAVFRRLLPTHRPEELNRDTVIDFLRANSKLTGTTLGRRADCILSWLKFISDHDPFDLHSTAVLASNEAGENYESYRSGSEGPLHLKLKNAVSEDPERHLGESLRLIKTEYEFPTNDRADIVFLDTRNRLVAVEIEVDVGAKDVPGLLQAVKYKHMLAVIFRVPPNAVRGMLVARALHSAMEKRARDYGIETRVVEGVV